MTYKKIALIGTAVILTVSLGVLKMETSNAQTEQTSSTSTEIPFTLSTPTDHTAVPNPTPTDTSTSATSASAAASTDPVTPVTTDTAPAPTVIFSASSDQYAGAGAFELPNFFPTNDWTVDYESTCDSGTTFAQVTIGSGSIPLHTGVNGPFSTKASKIRVVIPEEATNCHWSVSVS